MMELVLSVYVFNFNARPYGTIFWYAVYLPQIVKPGLWA